MNVESLATAKIIGNPIGTLQELADIGVGPEEIESCSRRTGSAAGGHKGCPWFRQCRFKPWRDQMNGLKGPLNIGVEIILSKGDGGAHTQLEASCFEYYTMSLKNRAKASDETGEIVRIVAYEGDGKSISSWCTRTIAPTLGSPNGSVEPYLHTAPVRPFKRPKERFPVEVGRQIAREDMMDDLERQALQNALAKNGATHADGIVDNVLADVHGTADIEFEGPVGKPRKVKDGG